MHIFILSRFGTFTGSSVLASDNQGVNEVVKKFLGILPTFENP